jgi:hypothetical protein
MQSKTESQVIQEIITKLAAKGIESFIVQRPSEEENGSLVDVLSVPAWEKGDGDLSREAVYEYIHSKLASQPGKGLITAIQGISDGDVYAYSPVAIDEDRALNWWDLNVCCTDTKLEKFSWEEMVDGDDTAWWDGWDTLPELGYLPRRVANLYLLANYQIVDMPPVEPLSEQELIEVLKKRGTGESLFCLSPDYNDRWSLRLNGARTLVLHKRSDNSLTPINQSNIDSKGRLVLDGQIMMHRCWGL